MAWMAAMPPQSPPPLKGPLFVIGKRDGDERREGGRIAIDERHSRVAHSDILRHGRSTFETCCGKLRERIGERPRKPMR